jgi:hypothetical protein
VVQGYRASLNVGRYFYQDASIVTWPEEAIEAMVRRKEKGKWLENTLK